MSISSRVARICAFAFTFVVSTAGYAQTGGGASANAETLEEVTVTAQKEAQNLQKTAAAITAISGESLLSAGVSDLRGAQMLVPQVRFQAEGNNTQVFIRGVGANIDQPNNEPSVGFSVNGAYVPREGTSAAFFDIAQIEVLPGPQGTLYGRAAIGGTVNVTFNRPAQNTDGTLLLEAGNFAQAHIAYAQNLPVTDTFSARLAVDYIRNDGFNTSGADAKDDTGVRVSGLYEPNDDLSLLVWAHYATKNGHPANLVNKGTDPVTFTYSENAFLNPNPWDDSRNGALAPLAVFGQAVADEQEYETFMTGAELNWNLGSVRLTYIPSYFYLDSQPQYWLGTIRANLNAHYNQIANELRLSNADPSSRVKWLAGLYAYNVRNYGPFYLFTNQPFEFASSDIRDNRIESYAAFGQVTLSASDTLRFTVGGRFSDDKREASGFAPAPVGGAPFSFSASYSNFDWKTGIEYDIAERAMLYGTIQTGYKPGTYNELPSTPAFDNAVKESTLLAFTAGLKTRLLGNTLQINTEIFSYDYDDFQIQAYDVSAPFNPVFNAQKVKIYGGQLDVLWAATGNSQLNLNVGYSRARNKKFVAPDGRDFTGLQPPYAPDWTVIAGYSHGFPAGNGVLRARVDARYESSWYADYVQNRGVRQDDSTKADAALTYESGGRWQLGAWIKNIGNKPVLAATAAAGIPGPATAYLEPPRTYGLRLTTQF